MSCYYPPNAFVLGEVRCKYSPVTHILFALSLFGIYLGPPQPIKLWFPARRFISPNQVLRKNCICQNFVSKPFAFIFLTTDIARLKETHARAVRNGVTRQNWCRAQLKVKFIEQLSRIPYLFY